MFGILERFLCPFRWTLRIAETMDTEYRRYSLTRYESSDFCVHGLCVSYRIAYDAIHGLCVSHRIAESMDTEIAIRVPQYFSAICYVTKVLSLLRKMPLVWSEVANRIVAALRFPSIVSVRKSQTSALT